MALIEFNDLTDEALFTRVSTPLPVTDGTNTNCERSMFTDGAASRLTSTLTPMSAGDNAISVSVTLKRLDPNGTEYVVTQKDSESFSGDSIWEFAVNGTGASQGVQVAYRENAVGTFLFAATDAGAFPNDTDEHTIAFSCDITNRLIFIMIDGVKPSHSSENLVGGSPAATAQGTVHNLSVGSRHSAAFSSGVEANSGRIQIYTNQFKSEAQWLAKYNSEQALLGTNPECTAVSVPGISGGIGRTSFRSGLLRQPRWNRGTRRYVRGSDPEVVLNLSFIASWKTDNTGDSDNDQIALPLEASGTYNFTVHWGDGSSDIITVWNQSETTHTYASAGTFTITIAGTIDGFSFNNTGDDQKILDISNWGTLLLGDSSAYFSGCVNLTVSATDDLDTSAITTMQSCFSGCAALTTVPGITAWDTSNVTTMRSMFSTATLFNQDLNGWDTSSVTDMLFLFSNATTFNGAVGDWDVTSVTGMDFLFAGAVAFNQPIDDWTTTVLETTSSMFSGADAFNQSVDSWNMSSVTTMANMFKSCNVYNKSMNSWNVEAVLTMADMFSGATLFNGNITSWTPSACTDMSSLFQSAGAFNQAINGWDVSAVTDMNSMFFSATAFNQDLNSWTVTSVLNMLNTFRGATLFNGNITSWAPTSCTDMSFLFAATAFNQAIGGWDVSSVLIMRSMFDEAASFNQALTSWTTTSVTDMNAMFEGATLFNQSIDAWNVAAVTDMSSMFRLAPAFNQVLSGWTTTAVLDMNEMFRGATAFNQDITGWDVAAVTDMSVMFLGATAFNQAVGGWTTSALTTVSNMFNGATAFDQNLAAWDVLELTTAAAMFSGVTLSTTNWSNLLIGWEGQAVLDNVTLDGGSSLFSAGAAATARAALISDHTWTITDGGAA